MQLEAKLIMFLPEEKGTSKNGKDWTKQLIIVESLESYPKKVCLELMKEDLIGYAKTLKLGESYKFSLNLESREYNNKWYNSIKCWRITDEESKPQQSNEETDSMPF